VTGLEILIQARAAGLRLAPRGDKLHVEPVPPPDLRAALIERKPEVLSLLRSERQNRAARLLSDTFDRLDRLGPWTSAEMDRYRDLGGSVDAACRRYVEGSAELPAVEAAVSKWEAALSAGRTPRSDAGEGSHEP
jgi:hypothetical protein